ncbi:hypothetical protein [Paraliobacillus sp. JSM ZJ581]|uniref:hypothetical protein n=1 Tax=Paraliobacillus sp. JSM ZJ581 TaxID=3342118 RepID=UPI0035A94C18
MLNKIPEENFLVLRRNFESELQKPSQLGRIFFVIIFSQAILMALEFFIKSYSIYPNIDSLVTGHLIVSIILGLFCIIYAIPAMYMKSQRMQYFIFILAGQNLFTVSMYLLTLIIISAEFETDSETLLNFTSIMLTISIILVILKVIIVLFQLRKGSYKKGSKKDRLRGRLESNSLFSIIFSLGIGATFIVQYFIRNFEFNGIDILIIATIFTLSSLFVLSLLPEQAITLYCKIRFDSFNYEQNGRLKPVRDEEGNIIME